MTRRREEMIRDRLQAAFDPTELTIVDESHLHIGHEGAKDGRGHFRVRIVAGGFANLSRLQRHKAIYAALGPLMQTDIHALSIEAAAPSSPATSH